MQSTAIRLGLRPDRHDGLRNLGGQLSIPCPSGGGALPSSQKQTKQLSTVQAENQSTKFLKNVAFNYRNPVSKHSTENLKSEVDGVCLYAERESSADGRHNRLAGQLDFNKIGDDCINRAQQGELLRQGLRDKLQLHRRVEMTSKHLPTCNISNKNINFVDIGCSVGNNTENKNCKGSQFSSVSGNHFERNFDVEQLLSDLRIHEKSSHSISSPIPNENHLCAPGTVIEETEYFSERKYSVDSSCSESTSDSGGIGSKAQVPSASSSTIVSSTTVRFAMPSMQFVWETDPSGEC